MPTDPDLAPTFLSIAAKVVREVLRGLLREDLGPTALCILVTVPASLFLPGRWSLDGRPTTGLRQGMGMMILYAGMLAAAAWSRAMTSGAETRYLRTCPMGQPYACLAAFVRSGLGKESRPLLLPLVLVPKYLDRSFTFEFRLRLIVVYTVVVSVIRGILLLAAMLSFYAGAPRLNIRVGRPVRFGLMVTILTSVGLAIWAAPLPPLAYADAIISRLELACLGDRASMIAALVTAVVATLVGLTSLTFWGVRSGRTREAG